MRTNFPAKVPLPALYLDRHQADLTGFLQKLIRLRTVNPRGENYGEITLVLAAAFNKPAEATRFGVFRM